MAISARDSVSGASGACASLEPRRAAVAELISPPTPTIRMAASCLETGQQARFQT
jgi:hypothetical protein